MENEKLPIISIIQIIEWTVFRKASSDSVERVCVRVLVNVRLMDRWAGAESAGLVSAFHVRGIGESQ